MKSVVAILLTTLTSVMADGEGSSPIYVEFESMTEEPYYNFYFDSVCDSPVNSSPDVSIPSGSWTVARCNDENVHAFRFGPTQEDLSSATQVIGITTETFFIDVGQTLYWECAAHPRTVDVNGNRISGMFGTFVAAAAPSHDSPSPSSESSSSSSSSGDSSQCSTYAALNRDYDSSAPVCPNGTITSGDVSSDSSAPYCQCTSCSQIEVYMAAEGEVCDDGNWAQSPPKAKCDSVGAGFCPANKVLIAAADSTDCAGDPCVLADDEDTCCVEKATCSGFTCPANKAVINATTLCDGASCVETEGSADENRCCGCVAGYGYDSGSGSCTECTDSTDPPQWNAAIDHSPCGNHAGCSSVYEYFDYNSTTNVGVCKDCADFGRGDYAITGYLNWDLDTDPFATLCNVCQYGYTMVDMGGYLYCDKDIPCAGHYVASGECSATCGGGEQTMTRQITTQPSGYHAINYGDCDAEVGPATKTVACNEHACPVNCEGSWSAEWSECSAQCGDGTQTKTYSVIRPAQHGGKACSSSDGDEMTQGCNLGDCKAKCDTFTCPSGFSIKTNASDIECAGTTCQARGTSSGDYGYGTEGWGQGVSATETMDLHRCCDYDHQDFSYVEPATYGMDDGCLPDKCYDKSHVGAHGAHGHRVCTWGSRTCAACKYCTDFAATVPATDFDASQSNCATSCRTKVFQDAIYSDKSVCAMSSCRGCKFCTDKETAAKAPYSDCHDKCQRHAWRVYLGQGKERPEFCYWNDCKTCGQCVTEISARKAADATKYPEGTNCNKDKCSRMAFLKTLSRYSSKYQDMCVSSSCKRCPQCITDKQTAVSASGDFTESPTCQAKCLDSVFKRDVSGRDSFKATCYWSGCKQCGGCVAEISTRESEDTTKYDDSVTNCDHAKCSKMAFLKTLAKYSSKYANMCLTSSCKRCPQCMTDKQNAVSSKGDYTVSSTCEGKCLDSVFKRESGRSGFDAVCYWSGCRGCGGCVTEKQERETNSASDYGTKQGCDAEKCSRWHFLSTISKYNTKYANFCSTRSCEGCNGCQSSDGHRGRMLRNAVPSWEETMSDWKSLLHAPLESVKEASMSEVMSDWTSMLQTPPSLESAKEVSMSEVMSDWDSMVNEE